VPLIRELRRPGEGSAGKPLAINVNCERERGKDQTAKIHGLKVYRDRGKKKRDREPEVRGVPRRGLRLRVRGTYGEKKENGRGRRVRTVRKGGGAPRQLEEEGGRHSTPEREQGN